MATRQRKGWEDWMTRRSWSVRALLEREADVAKLTSPVHPSFISSGRSMQPLSLSLFSYKKRKKPSSPKALVSFLIHLPSLTSESSKVGGSAEREALSDSVIGSDVVVLEAEKEERERLMRWAGGRLGRGR